LYRDNLEPDLAPYIRGQPHLSDLLAMLKALVGSTGPKHMTLLVLKDNTVHKLPFTKTQPNLTTKRVEFIKQGLINATQNGVKLPDTVALLNTWDEPRCGRRTPRCRVPVFSLIKQWNWASGTGVQTDVLIPFFNHYYQSIINYPWQNKEKKALMRAAIQNGMSANCTRVWLLQLAKTPDGQRLLDVGLTNNLKTGFKAELSNYVDIPDHSKWRYLISADGFTASCRFGKLLQTNSVVLKEESPWIEYYYRSVQAGKQYVAFTKDTVMQVLLKLEQEPDSRLQEIASNAQAFAYKYLSQHAKALYFCKAMRRYNELVRGVEEFARSLQPTDLADVASVVAAMENFVSVAKFASADA